MTSALPDPPRSSVLPPVPVPPLEAGQPPLAILVDYDGTIARTDVSDALMAEFVTADWESHVAEYDAGLVGSRRLMAWEVGLITADPDALRAKAAAQPHDPAFRPFAERALAAGVPVEVVSDGFGFFIEPALEALGVGGLPVVTAATTFGPGGARIEFPNGNPDCFVCGTCKRNRVLAHQAAGPGGGVHRRRAVGSLRRRLQRHRVREGVPRADLHRRGLAVHALDLVHRDRRLAGPAPSPRSRPTRRRWQARDTDPCSAARRSGARDASTPAPPGG